MRAFQAYNYLQTILIILKTEAKRQKKFVVIIQRETPKTNAKTPSATEGTLPLRDAADEPVGAAALLFELLVALAVVVPTEGWLGSLVMVVLIRLGMVAAPLVSGLATLALVAIAACWKAAKDLFALALMENTIPF